MGVYFFECFDGHVHHVDAFGDELQTDLEAGEQADALVHALIGENVKRGLPETAWVVVRSGDGRVVYATRLSLSRNWGEQGRPMPAGAGERDP